MLEPDTPAELLSQNIAVAVPDDLPPSEEERSGKLFPNSFRIAGTKHICDNLLSATLQTLPEYFGDQTWYIVIPLLNW